MNPVVITLVLSAVILLAALVGPAALRHAAPALARAPRASALLLTLSAFTWIAALLALGPVVAWISTGPALLPQQAAAVCNRCLSASIPFADNVVSLAIPAAVPLALPAAGLIAALAGLVRELFQLKRSQSALAGKLREGSESVVLHGHRVLLTPETQPLAFSLPHRRGGIILSRGTAATLSTEELAAVLKHEQAHLDQRHHLHLAILYGITRYFRWIPIIRSLRMAVSSCLEIAADRAATRVTGTAALASALLNLGQTPALAPLAAVPGHAVLHAAGSERILHLIGHPRPRTSTAIAATLSAYAFMLAAAIIAVHWPYLLALLTGC